MDLSSLGQDSVGTNLCTSPFGSMYLASIGVLADCDCSKTSLDPTKMPNQSLIPTIPTLIEIHMDDDPVEITFPVGGDTVSCVCGTADCKTWCDSEADMSIEFTDNITFLPITSNTNIFTWAPPTFTIKSLSEADIGFYSITVALKLSS